MAPVTIKSCLLGGVPSRVVINAMRVIEVVHGVLSTDLDLSLGLKVLHMLQNCVLLALDDGLAALGGLESFGTAIPCTYSRLFALGSLSESFLQPNNAFLSDKRCV